jgi:hypothetical protein
MKCIDTKLVEVSYSEVLITMFEEAEKDLKKEGKFPIRAVLFDVDLKNKKARILASYLYDQEK